MNHVMDALVQRNTCTYGKYQNCDDKAPEINLLAMTEREGLVRRFLGLFHTKQQQALIASINQ
jgi:hypothetical protein